MASLDGHYRHRGAAIHWDDAGVTLARADERQTVSVPWTHIDGACQIGERPGFVQVVVRGHVPPGDPRHDPFSIAVNSDPDANRLVTSIAWRAAAVRIADAAEEAARSPRRRRRTPRRGAGRSERANVTH